MIDYKLEGGSLPVVVCYPKEGETLKTEKGAMSWMSANMQMKTNTGGGGVLGRMFSGETIFLNEYTAVGGDGEIAFASSFPGSILPYHVTPGNDLIVQKRGFLAMEAGLKLGVAFQRKFGAGLFGGEGFIMQRISGDGLVFVEIDGACIKKELQPGEKLIVDTGFIAAYTGGCSIDVQTVKGVKNVLFGGEGLFNTVITGPGTVWLQSMPIYGVARAIQPYIVTSSK
ncbi:MAG: TIGR00266 family protein [Bacteroidaceae bacterium]|nr:TIGR00266 family protein [Bacteroidaceae bacterium]